MKTLFSSNAMATKAKAMYGNRLSAADYQELLHRRNVSEIAGYLKTETYYHEFMEHINEHTIHRGHLELMIRQSYYMRFMKLLRYGSRNNSFYKYGIIQVEIKQILSTLRALKEKDPLTKIAQTVELPTKYTTFDLSKLLMIDRYEALLDLLKPTMYYPVLLDLQMKSADDIDYTICEIAFKNFFYEYVSNIIEKEFKGKNKLQIHALFAAQMELDNIAKVYRLKKYYKASPEEIKKIITPKYHKISKTLLYEWIDTLDAQQFLDAVKHSPYQAYMGSREFVYIEYHMNAVKYNLSKYHMRFSNNPDLILFSYLLVLETELQNLIDIIEGVRYNVPPDKISRLLIY